MLLFQSVDFCFWICSRGNFPPARKYLYLFARGTEFGFRRHLLHITDGHKQLPDLPHTLIAAYNRYWSEFLNREIYGRSHTGDIGSTGRTENVGSAQTESGAIKLTCRFPTQGFVAAAARTRPLMNVSALSA